jgi:hypothetical protein
MLLKKNLEWSFRATLIQDEHRIRKFDQETNSDDSIVARRRHSADFFNSIGQNRKRSH